MFAVALLVFGLRISQDVGEILMARPWLGGAESLGRVIRRDELPAQGGLIPWVEMW